MPRNVIISKENILNAGFDITRKYGINKVSNRELAKYLKEEKFIKSFVRQLLYYMYSE